MLGLGLPEILVVLVLVFVLFGAGKLPQVMGDLGKGLTAFKDGMGGKGSRNAAVNGRTEDAALPRGRRNQAAQLRKADAGQPVALAKRPSAVARKTRKA